MLHIFNKSCQLTSWQGATRVLLLAVTSLALYGTNSAEAALTCDQCHMALPLDATARNNPAGRFQGSHVKHTAVAEQNLACTVCHPSNAAATHSDGTVNMANPLNGNSGASYTKGSFALDPTATLAPGHCDNTYCHSDGTGGTTQSGETRPIPANSSINWGVTSACNSCHGVGGATDGRPYYADDTLKQNDHGVGGHNKTCDICHDSVTYSAPNYTPDHTKHNRGTYNIKAAMGYTYNVGGGSCTTSGCHGTAQWGVTVLDCVSCHTSTVNITIGPLTGQTRAAVSATLKSSATRNHKSTAVGADATKYDCIVCHMEGDMATGSTSASHGNGVIDFRDPDTGVQAKKVSFTGILATRADYRFKATATNFTTARFSRNLSVTFENDPNFLNTASIQMNLCLKCHDYNGAANSSAWTKNSAGTLIGSANQPFGQPAGSTSTLIWVTATRKTAAGNVTGAVMNVFTQLSSSNASYHPVTQKNNLGYATATQMKAPWSTATTPTAKVQRTNTIYGWLISCFDCHAPRYVGGTTLNSSNVAHGNGTWTTPQTLGPAYSTTATAAAPNLCTMCHADGYATTANNHMSGGSGFNGGSSMGTTTMGNCRMCHGAVNNTPATRAVHAHGADSIEGGPGNHTSGRPYAFIRGSQWTDWAPGSCNNTCTTRTYTPGGMY